MYVIPLCLVFCSKKNIPIIISLINPAVKFIHTLILYSKMFHILIILIPYTKNPNSIINRIEIVVVYDLKSIECANPNKMFLKPYWAIRYQAPNCEFLELSKKYFAKFP